MGEETSLTGLDGLTWVRFDLFGRCGTRPGEGEHGYVCVASLSSLHPCLWDLNSQGPSLFFACQLDLAGDGGEVVAGLAAGGWDG